MKMGLDFIGPIKLVGQPIAIDTSFLLQIMSQKGGRIIFMDEHCCNYGKVSIGIHSYLI
jgi:hypothetical protein